ncbi:hypothetical protein JWG45_04325, partial [Leptospira sp. 201903070]|nr:hypothetical protein [Leptospira ainlahdjerensis]
MKQVNSPFSGSSSHFFRFSLVQPLSVIWNQLLYEPSVARGKFLNSNQSLGHKKFFSPFLKRAVSGLLLLTFFFTFILPISEFSELKAQSVPQLNSTRAFTNADLQPYVDAGRLQNDQSSFMNIVNGGEQAVEASWEAAVDA